MADYRKQDPRKLAIKVGSGVDARQYNGIKGNASKDSLIGKNTLKEHRPSAPDKSCTGGKHASK